MTLTSSARRHPRRELVEQLDPVHRAVRVVVAVHEAGRRLVVPVQEQTRSDAALAVRVVLLAQEAAPLVLPGAERRQPAVEARARAPAGARSEKYAVVSCDAYAQLNVKPNWFAMS